MKAARKITESVCWKHFVYAFICTVLCASCLGLFGQTSRRGGLSSLSGIIAFMLFAYIARMTAHTRSTNARIWKYGRCFTLSLLFFELLGSAMRINGSTGNTPISAFGIIIFVLTAIFLSSPILCVGIELVLLVKAQIAKWKPIQSVSFIKTWIILTAFWIPSLLAFYPAVFSYDVDWQLLQYLRGLGSYSTHHPVIHTLLMGGLFQMGNDLFGNFNSGLALYAAVQMISLTAVVAYSLSFLIRFSIPKQVWLAIGAYYLFMPIYSVLGVSTTKDIFFTVFFLWAFVCLAGILSGKGRDKKAYSLLMISLIFMQLFRNNAVFGLILLLCWLLLTKGMKKNRLLIIIIALSILLSKGCLQFLKYTTQASDGSVAEVLSVPCQQIARAYNANKDRMDETDKQKIFEFLPEECLTNYREEISDPIKKNLNVELIQKHPEKFVKLWKEIGIKYPSEYCTAFLYNTLGLWYIDDISHINAKKAYLEVGFKTLNPEIPEFQNLNIEKRSLWPEAEKFYEWTVVNCNYLKIPIISLLFSPAFYIWLIILGICIILFKGNVKYMPLPIFLLGYAATLLGGPCILPRYCMNFMLCTPILLCILCSSNHSE